MSNLTISTTFVGDTVIEVKIVGIEGGYWRIEVPETTLDTYTAQEFVNFLAKWFGSIQVGGISCAPPEECVHGNHVGYCHGCGGNPLRQ